MSTLASIHYLLFHFSLYDLRISYPRQAVFHPGPDEWG